MAHEQRQVLEMLADSPRGVTEAVLATHGLASNLLARLGREVTTGLVPPVPRSADAAPARLLAILGSVLRADPWRIEALQFIGFQRELVSKLAEFLHGMEVEATA